MDSLNHYFDNVDKIFTANFTLLAFIITAITILLMIDKGIKVKFQNANLLQEAMEYFYKSLNFNFISGIFALIIWIINIKSQLWINITSVISIVLLFISLYYTYQAYKFLIFFVKKQ